MNQTPAEDLRRARISALVLGGAVVLTLISFVYGLVQLTAAKEANKTAVFLQRELESCRLESAKLRDRLEENPAAPTQK